LFSFSCFTKGNCLTNMQISQWSKCRILLLKRRTKRKDGCCRKTSSWWTCYEDYWVEKQGNLVAVSWVQFIFLYLKKCFNDFLCMQLCSGSDKNFVVINQKGIDPPSLDLLARAGVSKLWLIPFGSELIVFFSNLQFETCSQESWSHGS
jgi:hypothetical protein